MEWWKRIRWVLIYGVFYMLAFYIIENRTVRINIIHAKLDNYIPFCEYFVIPYFLWFLFIAATIIYFAFFNKSRQEYYSLIINLGIGMTIFIVVSWVYPNGHILRPTITGDGILDQAVRFLHSIDTPTNIFPSIHVFNSIACCMALIRNEACRCRKILSAGIMLLTVLIIMSTVLLKQHSIIDVAGALTMSGVLYPIAYPKSGHISVKDKRTGHSRIHGMQ